MRMQNEEHGEDMATLTQQQTWEGALREHQSTRALWEHRSTLGASEHRSTKVGCRQAYVPEKWALRSLRQLRALDSSGLSGIEGREKKLSLDCPGD